MTIFDATEQAFKNGYNKGYHDAMVEVKEKLVELRKALEAILQEESKTK